MKIKELRENNKKKSTNIKDFSKSFYQTKAWKHFREESRKINRSKDEQAVVSLYENNKDIPSEALIEFYTHEKQYPLCVHCKAEGKLTIANTLDHIRPISEGGAKLKHSNTQWLCPEHHYIKTQKEIRNEYV